MKSKNLDTDVYHIKLNRKDNIFTFMKLSNHNKRRLSETDGSKESTHPVPYPSHKEKESSITLKLKRQETIAVKQKM